MRPIQVNGTSPDGLWQWLWLRSRDGALHANARMLALEYGLTLPRFQTLLDQLETTGRIVNKRPGANASLKSWMVADPGPEDEDRERPTRGQHELAGAGHQIADADVGSEGE